MLASRPASRLATQTNPSGVPYRLLIQFERAQLLASAGRREDAQEHARRLVSEMSSGRWTLDKATFTLYDSAARKIAGLRPAAGGTRGCRGTGRPPLERMAKDSRRAAHRSATHHGSGNTDPPVVALVNTNAERLVALDRRRRLPRQPGPRPERGGRERSGLGRRRTGPVDPRTATARPQGWTSCARCPSPASPGS